jgi:hypothetical protein
MSQRSTPGLVLGTVLEVAAIVVVVSLLPRVDLRPRESDRATTLTDRWGNAAQQPVPASTSGTSYWQPTSYQEPYPAPTIQPPRETLGTGATAYRQPPALITADPDVPPRLAASPTTFYASPSPPQPLGRDSGSFPTHAQDATPPMTAPRGSFPVSEWWASSASAAARAPAASALWPPIAERPWPLASSSGRDRATATTLPPQPQRWRTY